MILLRIPCKESFAFIEEQYEGNDIKGRYDELYAIMNGANRYSETKFNEIVTAIINSDLTAWQITTDDYQHLTESQKVVMQAIKRFKARLPEVEE